MFSFLYSEKCPTVFSTCTESECIFVGLCEESLGPELKFMLWTEAQENKYVRYSLENTFW